MISRIAAVHSVAPIISDPIYGPKTLNCQLISGLLVTSGMMPSAPGAVILNLPANSNIAIIPMLQTRKGIFRSATNAAIFVRTLFACDASADVVSVIKGLLHEGRFEPGFPIWTSASRIICFSRPRQQRICHQGGPKRDQQCFVRLVFAVCERLGFATGSRPDVPVDQFAGAALTHSEPTRSCFDLYRKLVGPVIHAGERGKHE